LLWLLGQAPARGVLAAIGDLLLAGVFAWWLVGSRHEAPANAPGSLGLAAAASRGEERERPRAIRADSGLENIGLDQAAGRIAEKGSSNSL
jgi:hypothetical protein